MNDIVTIITNNGIGVACVFYLIYFNHTTLKEIQKTLWEFNLQMKDMTNILGIMKQELQELKGKKK